MPFDGVTTTARTVRLEDMPAILRDRSRWPDGFQWEYRCINDCALGLGSALGGSWPEWRRQLGVSEFMRIFCDQSPSCQPDHVARLIEQALAPRVSFWRRIWGAV